MDALILRILNKTRHTTESLTINDLWSKEEKIKKIIKRFYSIYKKGIFSGQDYKVAKNRLIFEKKIVYCNNNPTKMFNRHEDYIMLNYKEELKNIAKNKNLTFLEIAELFKLKYIIKANNKNIDYIIFNLLQDLVKKNILCCVNKENYEFSVYK